MFYDCMLMVLEQNKALFKFPPINTVLGIFGIMNRETI